jgi:hypothetical protein
MGGAIKDSLFKKGLEVSYLLSQSWSVMVPDADDWGKKKSSRACTASLVITRVIVPQTDVPLSDVLQRLHVWSIFKQEHRIQTFSSIIQR